MLVELDIFSGRPNPRWTLDEPAERELQRLEQSLSPAEAAPLEPPPLGYRGFLYTVRCEPRRAFGGLVERPGGALADPGFSVERLLLDTLPADLASLRDRLIPLLSRPSPQS